MDLNRKLPPGRERVLNLKAGETIWYCAPCDIGTDGRFQTDTYVIVTNDRLFLLQETEVKSCVELKQIEKLVCEPGVNNGILILTRKAGGEELFARFSMKHVSRMAFIAKGAMQLRDGDMRPVICREYEKTCPICGRALGGTRECPKCSNKPSVLMKFLKMCRQYRARLCLIALFMVLAAVIELLVPKLQQVFIDDYLRVGKGSMKVVAAFAGIMAAVTVVRLVVAITRYWLCTSMGTRISKDFRQMLYHKVQVLSLSFIQERRAGALMNRITGDTRQIRRFMEEAFAGMFSCIVTMVAAITIMLMMNWKLTLLTIAFMPAALFVSIAFFGSIHRRFHMQWHKSDKSNTNLQDVLSGMRVVKSFGTEAQEAEHFRNITKEYAVIQKRNEKFWATLFPMISFLMSLGIYAVTIAGGREVIIDGMTVGQLTQFIGYAWILFGPLQWMTFLPRQITQLMTSLERIYDILDEEPQIQNHEHARKMQLKGAVEFRDVSFGYRSYEPVLEHIDLQVKPGEMIGLVGASGTGKSTMINLIMRLYEVDNGSIFVDGVNINELDTADYHSQIGVVLQENFLFAGTIYNNLRFARPDAAMEEIIRAAKMANAHDFILKTPDGYNTYVGEHGYSLSGGERQRLAIARAILNHPKLLILDEATSALDTESEYLIQKALERLRSGCTTFAIAHRLSTLKDADRLVVIDGHQIAEIGTHDELMEKKGIYYGLVTAQLSMSALPADA